MNREPDWESLAEINFLMYRRMTEHLNAALAAISLVKEGGASAAPDAKPDGFWEDRAEEQVMEALSLHNAWASLVRHQNGEQFLQQHLRHFPAQDLMVWVAKQLQLPSPPDGTKGMMLMGNRETLQEALLLLRSFAYTLGSRVRLIADGKSDGIWFHVRYDRGKKQPPRTLQQLLDSMQGNWRSQSAAFELRRARDFLSMNGCELKYTVTTAYCELSFFVKAVGKNVPGKTAAKVPNKVDDTHPNQNNFDAQQNRTTTEIAAQNYQTAIVEPSVERAARPANDGVAKPQSPARQAPSTNGRTPQPAPRNRPKTPTAPKNRRPNDPTKNLRTF